MKIMTTPTNEACKTAPVYVVRNDEMVINVPVREAWRHVVNYSSWQNYSIVENVSGEPGQEGEVVILKKEEVAVSGPSYLARTVKLDPERKIIWKTYRENDSSHFGIIEFRISEEASGKTRFYNSMLYEHVIAYESHSEIEEFRKQQYESIAALCATIFPKLKQLAEHGK